jgi:hypothetical protein
VHQTGAEDEHPKGAQHMVARASEGGAAPKLEAQEPQAAPVLRSRGCRGRQRRTRFFRDKIEASYWRQSFSGAGPTNGIAAGNK